jgi:hypothetical protein
MAEDQGFPQVARLMSSKKKQAKIERLKALTSDQAHIHRNALRLAGIYLQGAEDEIVEREVTELDEDIQDDEELYAAHEALIEAIAKEVVKIGEGLKAEAKQLKKT